MFTRPRARPLFLAALLALAPASLLLTGSSSAQESSSAKRPARPWRPPVTVSANISLEDEHGRPLRTFVHQGQSFVLGHFGQRYNVRVRNLTSSRVEAVISVDGRDAVSGRPADFVRDRGYVIDPGESVLVEGFRTSLSEVAAFRFTDPADSYSARMGTPENVGVIGVALFPEQRRKAPLPLATPRGEHKKGKAPTKSSDAAEPRPAPRGRAPAPRRAQNLGTEFGEAKLSQVREVSFVRANAQRPNRVLTLRYDDAEGLAARGIDVFPVPRTRDLAEPDPFPGSRFAPPPPAR